MTEPTDNKISIKEYNKISKKKDQEREIEKNDTLKLLMYQDQWKSWV